MTATRTDARARGDGSQRLGTFDSTWGRRGALIGPGAAAALYVGLSLFGDTPDPGDPAAQIDAYFTTNRTSMLFGVVLVGLACSALLVAAVRMASLLDDAGDSVTARIATSAATVVVTALAVGLLVPYAALASVIGAEVPEFGKGLFELTIVLTPVLAIPLALLIGTVGIGLRRADIGRRWFARTSVAVALALLVSACSFASDGALSPDVQQQLVFTLLAGWLIASGFGTRPPPMTVAAP